MGYTRAGGVLLEVRNSSTSPARGIKLTGTVKVGACVT